MTAWLLALGAGLLFAALQYGRLVAREGAGVVPPAMLRFAAITLLVALLLDARAGRDDAPSPLVALDASRSWTRGDTTRWGAALARARALVGDSLLLFGDSLRLAGETPTADDVASTLSSAAELAAARGRPVVLVTDGHADVPAEGLDALPQGSRVEVLAPLPRVDLAVASIEAPRALASGDTLRLQALVRSGAAATPAATLRVSVGGQVVATSQVPALGAWSATTVSVAARLVAPEGTHPLVATIDAAGDVEPRNDTMTVALDVSPRAGAVWISSAPDLDGRAALAVLRGTLGVPTRGYLQVAPGTWRVEGTLMPVSEAEVRAAVRDAPLLVVHGDTAVFGPPRALAAGAPLALLPGPGRDQGAAPAPGPLDEWYPTSAPQSPAATALAGIAWDSLPPVSLGAAASLGAPSSANAWVAVEGRRARRGTAVPFIVGTESPRRIVVSRATGMWRWQSRGGPGAVAYTGLWGSLFDWLAAARRDRRTAIPEQPSVREGEVVRWRVATDSMHRVTLRRRGDTPRDTTLTLSAATGTSFATSPPLRAGIYEVAAAGGRSLLVVNAASELIPRAPTVRGGAHGRAGIASSAPALREHGLAYAAIILLLSVEWVLRRRRGLR